MKLIIFMKTIGDGYKVAMVGIPRPGKARAR
jgi:hypothetical protein